MATFGFIVPDDETTVGASSPTVACTERYLRVQQHRSGGTFHRVVMFRAAAPPAPAVRGGADGSLLLAVSRRQHVRDAIVKVAPCTCYASLLDIRSIYLIAKILGESSCIGYRADLRFAVIFAAKVMFFVRELR